MDKLSITDCIMKEAGIPNWGVAAYSDLSCILEYSVKKRLPECPQSVLTALFPYYCGEREGANLSKYCIPRDYHDVAGELLACAAAALKAAFPGHAFVPFCDSSPVPEVEAAWRAGLGVKGKNGLLISPEYGSYVFIGEIVTDLLLPPCQKTSASCDNCGACVAACPTGALGEGFEKSRCLSAITQKKGELAPWEAEAVKKGGLVWGCDRCQDVCPMNNGAKKTEIAAFQTSQVHRLLREEVFSEDFTAKNHGRAYMWRGANVLKRNICIIESTPEDNK